MFKKLVTALLIGGRRGFAERPSSKKVAALKKIQEVKEDFSVVEIKLPEIGESLMNVNFSTGQPDPILLPDTSYPNWIFKARGPCRAAIRSQPFESIQVDSNSESEIEKLAQLKRFLRSENRKLIRKNNQMLKSASQ